MMEILSETVEAERKGRKSSSLIATSLDKSLPVLSQYMSKQEGIACPYSSAKGDPMSLENFNPASLSLPAKTRLVEFLSPS